MSKEIARWYVEKIQRQGPEPSKWQLTVRIQDEWVYRYEALLEGEPFKFLLKRRPDGSRSENDITPVSIWEFFRKSPNFDLVGEKMIVLRGMYIDGRRGTE